MMKKQIAGVVFAASIVGGVGAGVLANALTSEGPASATDGRTTSAPTSTPTTPPTTAPAAAPTTASDLTIQPGALGPVSVGMSKKDAIATGLFDADVPPPVEGCQVVPLQWKKPFVDTVDVQTVGNGEITSLGVRAKGPTTKDGLGIGSTLADVQATLDDADPVEAGYGQTGLFDYDADTGRWIGYLFDAAPGAVKATDPVTFIEVTKGSQPGLMRDGC